MTIQPARHECHACCLQWTGSLAFQPIVDNTRGTPCRAGCIVISENPQGLATHMVLAVSNVLTAPIFSNSHNFEMEGDTPEKHGIKSLDP